MCTNYAVRTGAFAYSFLVIGLHLWQQSYGPVTWALLALPLLAYPHLLYWRAMRSAHPAHAELDNPYVDSSLLGAWVGFLGFPTWIGYGLLASTLLNATVNRGLQGAFCALGNREQLRASEERYRLITENAGDLVAMVDRDSRWLYASPSYERLLEPADLERGTDAFRRQHPDDAQLRKRRG